MFRFTSILIYILRNSKKENYPAIISGNPWYTEHGDDVSAHGANIIKEGDKLYLFGEYKNNENNQFEGFSCYSSTDRMNWEFKGIAMPPNDSGRLSGPHYRRAA